MRDSGWSSHEPLAASSSSGCHPFSVGGFDVASGGYGPTSAYSLHAYGGEYSSSSGGTGSFGYLAPLHSIGNRISSKVPLSVRLNNFDYTTESSSVNSTNPFYSANTNRPTLPSITTTTLIAFWVYHFIADYFGVDTKMLLSVEKALPLRRRSCNITVVWPCKDSTRRSSSAMPGV
uniref:Uncharacterized protein n=1 Tax=Ascaris lumbricoides TaxID=6252 RepID=A0A0M3IS51_ASCLU